jgi:hypothetical protein
MTQRHPNTERFGGPGASNENAVTGVSSKRPKADPGKDKVAGKRNPHHSAISGGGGELDSHHTHDPKLKG